MPSRPISKDGLLMWFCYPFTPVVERVGRHNACVIVWKMLWMIPFWPLYLILKTFDILIIRGVGSIFAFILFGFRPVISFRWVNIGRYDSYGTERFPYKIFVPIKKWPIKRSGLKPHLENLALAHVIVGVLYVAMFIVIFSACAFVLWYFFVVIVFGTSAGRITIGVIALAFTVLFSFSFLADLGFWNIISEYIKAKKERYCPIIEVK